MKKILFILLISIVTLTGNAQIYSTIKHLDKFDDVVKTENVKTRITIHELDSTEWFGIPNLSIIEIETKGKEPVKYFSIYKTSFGNEDDIEEITDGVYGHQTYYFCVRLKQIITLKKYTEFLNLKIHFLNVLLDKEELNEGEFIMVDRTVTTQYSKTFLNRLFWVKYNDDSRTIYLNN